MNKQINTRSITRWLIYLNALIWLSFALITALDLHPAIPEGPLYRWGMSVMAFLTGISLIVLYHLLSKGYRIALYLLLIGFGLISILTITDQFGIYDLIVLILNLAIFLLLIKERHQYLTQ